MLQGHESHSDMRHGHFLNSTRDMAINMQQRHATLTFLRIDRRRGYPPSRAPVTLLNSSTWSPGCCGERLYMFLTLQNHYALTGIVFVIFLFLFFSFFYFFFNF